MIKVSFDFDDCLGHFESIQKYCKELIQNPNIEVWIVTSRPENPKEFFRKKYPDDETFKRDDGILWWSNEDDLFPLATELGIPRERIIFTNHEPKAWWFDKNGNGFVFHLDDNPQEIRLINQLTKITPISCLSSNWKQKCEKIIKKHLSSVTDSIPDFDSVGEGSNPSGGTD